MEGTRWPDERIDERMAGMEEKFDRLFDELHDVRGEARHAVEEQKFRLELGVCLRRKHALLERIPFRLRQLSADVVGTMWSLDGERQERAAGMQARSKKFAALGARRGEQP